MSIDKIKLEKDKSQLSELFEAGRGGKADAAHIKQLREQFYEIREVYLELISSQDGSTARYEYIEFCLDYIASHISNKEGSAYINLENDIFSHCSDTVCNDDFPAQLEEKMLAAIKEKSLENIYNIQRLAKKMLDEERYTRAIGYYQAMSDRLTSENEWHNWAHCNSAQEAFSVAADIIKKGLEVYPDSQLLMCDFAFYLFSSKKKKEALKVLDAFIKRVETKKYTSDNYYNYAINLKITLYREYEMALYELIEYSRLTATGGCDREGVIRGVEQITPAVKAMNYG